MDAQAEWFVSLGVGFRGPFTTSEVEEQIERLLVGRENLIWSDGMKDWQPLSQVEEFKPLIERAVPFVHESPWMEDGERDFSTVLKGIPAGPRPASRDFKKSLSSVSGRELGAKLRRYMGAFFLKKPKLF